jgi:hypothetical protein
LVIRILFLSANPNNENILQTALEHNEIDEKLRLLSDRDRFDLVQRHAITTEDLVSIIFRYEPQIIHFAGHGSTNGELVFQDSDGNPQLVPPVALTELFKIINEDNKIKCVFLNACYTEGQAEAISNYVDFVIGITNSIDDKTARVFSAYFYQALGNNKTILQAFNLAKIQLKLSKNPQHDIPKLKHPPDKDPSKAVILNEDKKQIKDNNLVENEIKNVIKKTAERWSQEERKKAEFNLENSTIDKEYLYAMSPTTTPFVELKKWFPWI